MNRDFIIEARNHSYELMLIAQAMKDEADTPGERIIADSLYDMNWAANRMLTELERWERRAADG